MRFVPVRESACLMFLLVALLAGWLSLGPLIAWAGEAPTRDSGGAAAASKGSGIEIPTLREAVKAGTIRARGLRPRSYQKVVLRLENRAKVDVSVDICGSYLTPRTPRSCQRLGLGPVVTPRDARQPRPGMMVLDLAPGEVREVEVNTCCLDAGRRAPSNQEFVVANAKLPQVREGVLRWWADHPRAPQGVVNSAIWQSRATVGWDPKLKVVTGGRSYESNIVSNAGMRYLLRGGELMSQDEDGVQCFLGTDILDVYPTDSAIYAEALGVRRVAGGARPRELWRLVPTGDEPWKLVATLPTDISIRDLRVAPEGAILLIAREGLYRVDPATKRVTSLAEVPKNDSLSLRFEKRGRVLYTVKKRSKQGYYQGGELKGAAMATCELYRLNLATNKSEHVRTYWNVAQIRMGAAGVFALTPGGKLRRLHGKSFRNVGGTLNYERILFVGRKSLWVETRHGRLVALSPSGSPRFRTGPRSPAMLRIDRHTDEVLYVDGASYLVLGSSKGKTVELESR